MRYIGKHMNCVDIHSQFSLGFHLDLGLEQFMGRSQVVCVWVGVGVEVEDSFVSLGKEGFGENPGMKPSVGRTWDRVSEAVQLYFSNANQVKNLPSHLFPVYMCTLKSLMKLDLSLLVPQLVFPFL